MNNIIKKITKKFGKNKLKKVYIIEGYLPNGGTYMAYQVGRVVAEEFGHEPIIVGRRLNEKINFFEYEDLYPVVSFIKFEKEVTENDAIIINPSFSS